MVEMGKTLADIGISGFIVLVFMYLIIIDRKESYKQRERQIKETEKLSNVVENNTLFMNKSENELKNFKADITKGFEKIKSDMTFISERLEKLETNDDELKTIVKDSNDTLNDLIETFRGRF
ncbi:MAG: hypothetical protein PUG22_04610 [Peptoniphilaceae bacterium]|nr:hypothetical protein [Peptoniphilaceae bacterium]